MVGHHHYRAAAWISATALVIVIGAAWYGSAQVRSERQDLADSDLFAVQMASRVLSQHLVHASIDIRFLASLPSLRAALEGSQDDALVLAAADFAAYGAAHAEFDQLRWIDESGMERVRVDFDGRLARIAAAEELQDKSQRAYVEEASRLPAGTVYVSAFDLNIENCAIEVPHTPVIRVATPLFDAAGRGRGVVVVNYLGREILEDFQDSVAGGRDRLMLLNHDGFWLRGQQREDEWGFMLDHGASLRGRLPAVWQAMQAEPSGQRELQGALWTWSSFDPAASVGGRLGSQNHDSIPVATAGSVPWVVAAVTGEAEWMLPAIAVWVRVGVSAVLLLVVAVPVIVSQASSRRRIEILNGQLQDRAEAAELANEAKAAFLANMSHEIRTPMHAILGLSYLLHNEELPNDAAKIVHKIERAGRLLQGIINDILDFSRIEAGGLSLERTPFALGEVLDNLAVVMANTAGDKDIELVISPPPWGLGRLYGDPLRLEQVLINLAGNAIKFTEKGQVNVEVAMLDHDDFRVQLRFTVTDTGIGIPEEQQQAIFQAFTQGDVSTTRRFGGTGLGLTISQRLVHLMGGEIGMSSVPGEGSRFWFDVTLERVAEAMAQQSDLLALDVLVADDNEAARDALCRIVMSLGWRPHAVESGEAAVRRALDRTADAPRFSVIVLDWGMPDLDGLAAARQIAEATVDGRAPIVIMVKATAEPTLHAEPASRYVDEVLVKPVTPSALYEAVARIWRARTGDGASPMGTPAPSSRLAGVRMLVVDDSDLNREVAKRVFEAAGASVFLANDGRQAVDWLAAHVDAIDVVLMDVQMPVMDGYKATATIRQIPALADLPVVALTAGALASQREAAMSAGMDDFIAKPFDVDSAVALICTLVERRRAASAGDRPAYPGLAIEQALKVWKDADAYRRFLRKFAADYADSAHRIAAMAPDQAAQLAHKLKGAAGSLALNDVMEAADHLVRELRRGRTGNSAVARLREEMSIALESIGHYAPSADARPDDRLPVNLALAEPIIRATLQSLDRDEPGEVELHLESLDRVLPGTLVAPIRARVEDFDFRGAESALRDVAQQLGVSLDR